MHRMFVLAAVMAPAAAATAQPAAPHVLVVETGLEPPCVKNDEVAAAITRHASLAAEVVATAEQVDRADVTFDATFGDAFEVRMQGEAAKIEVRLRGGGRDLSRVLAGLPCASIPDVVAAFVATALAPAPEAELPALDLSPPAPRFDGSERDVANSVRSERLLILAESLRRYEEWRYQTGMVLLGALGAATGYYATGVIDGNRWGDGLIVGGSTAVVISGAVGAMAPESTAVNRVVEVGTVAGSATMIIGMAFDDNAGGTDDPGDHFRESTALIGAGYLAAGVWMAVDHYVDPPTTNATLNRMHERLRTPAQRARVNDAEMIAFDRTFRRARHRHRYMIPVAIGVVAAMVQAAGEEPDEQEVGLAVGATQLVFLSTILLVPDPPRSYVRRIRNAGVSLGTMPMHGGGALALRGRF